MYKEMSKIILDMDSLVVIVSTAKMSVRECDFEILMLVGMVAISLVETRNTYIHVQQQVISDGTG